MSADQAHFAAAAAHHRAGDLARAETGYREILRRQPDHADALHLLGLIRLQTGDPEGAEELIGKAIRIGGGRIDAGQPDYYLNRSEALRQLGRHEEATADGRKALDSAPADPTVRYGLALALVDGGAFDEAARQLQEALRLDPDFAAAHNSLGVCLIELDRLDEAETHLRRAIEIDPGNIEAQGNLGALLVKREKHGAARDRYGKVLELDPDNAEAHYALARLLGGDDRWLAAHAHARRAHELVPENEDYFFEHGVCLAELDDDAAAADIFRRILDARPNDAEARFWLGMCLQKQGRFDQARALYEAMLADDPGSIQAHVQRARIDRGKADAARIAEFARLLATPDLSDRDRSGLGFVLAEMHDAAGDTDDAFEYYRQANADRGGAALYDAARAGQFFARVRAAFSPELMAAKRAIGTPTDRPIFIVGMPRSGTTLVEQILASHPEVFGCGELEDLGYAARTLQQATGAAAPYPDCIDRLEAPTARKIAGDYLDRLGARSGGARRVTDKMPGNFEILGLIALLFPNARIVHCRRDPMDTCLSGFFQFFAKGLLYTYDLSNLGVYYRIYEDMMAHWTRLLPGRILDLDYEALVGDLESQSRRLVAHCGLDWDDRCLAFHETERSVRTASFQQVREPIYASSIGRWRRYEKHLDPLKQALGL